MRARTPELPGIERQEALAPGVAATIPPARMAELPLFGAMPE
jgi:hypothetical protein